MSFQKPKGKLSEQVRQIRAALGEDTALFAARFARSARTVEDWEQGRRNPDALCQRLLDALQTDAKTLTE